jgi:hypothetical protein
MKDLRNADWDLLHRQSSFNDRRQMEKFTPSPTRELSTLSSFMNLYELLKNGVAIVSGHGGYPE